MTTTAAATALERKTGGNRAVEALRAQGIDTVFALPGVQLDPLFNAFHDAGDGLRVIESRHEQGVAYMAFGYAEATGRTGTFAVVPGPGMLNAAAALSTAFACRSPVLGLVGQVRSDRIGQPRGELHEIPDQSGILARLSRSNGLATAPDEVAPAIAAAGRALAKGDRPAVVELPPDVLAASCPEAPPVPGRSGPKAP
ncbi:thiamine pyrophosphate-binding protein [Salipiger mucosus]|nr:thiamine pyrophosphate-binding protein [Salipiger mucosus]